MRLFPSPGRKNNLRTYDPLNNTTLCFNTLIIIINITNLLKFNFCAYTTVSDRSDKRLKKDELLNSVWQQKREIQNLNMNCQF